MSTVRINVAPDILKKLRIKHNVSLDEVEECFLNREKDCLIDLREDHRTNPHTQWFIAPTDKGRLLKIVWIMEEGLGITLKTAFEPSQEAIDFYNRHT